MSRKAFNSWLKYLLLAAPLACLAAWLAAGGVRGSFGPDFSSGIHPANSAPASGSPPPVVTGPPAPPAAPKPEKRMSIASGSPGTPSEHQVPQGSVPPKPSPTESSGPAAPVSGAHPPPGSEPPKPPATPSSAPLNVPVLGGFPPPDEEYPADRLFERVDGAADALIAAGCERLLFWRIADPPAEMEVLVFDRPEGAARVLARDAGEGRDPGPGDEASVSDQSIFFRRGRFYVRIVGDPESNRSRERLLELGRRADRGLPSSRSDSGGEASPEPQDPSSCSDSGREARPGPPRPAVPAPATNLPKGGSSS
jgi:uncharacterized protein DUF6599